MKTISTQIFLFLFTLAIFLLIGSCVLPVYLPPTGERLIDTSIIRPGITTKEEVLLKFGYTFKISQDEKLFTSVNFLRGYSGWFVFVGAGYSGMGGMVGEKKIEDLYEIEIEFDDNDLVKRCETFKYPRITSQETKSTENK